MTTDLLKDKGFGVVAYYTGTSQYAAGQSTTEPNFMYNTKVSGENWGYLLSFTGLMVVRTRVRHLLRELNM